MGPETEDELRRVLFTYAHAQVRALHPFCEDKGDAYTIVEQILAMTLFNVDEGDISRALEMFGERFKERRATLR